jgi:vancomycin resistance protein YoaR
MDKAVLVSIIAELEKSEGTEKLLPVTITEPEITAGEAQASLFRDTLATMHTQFSTSDENDRNRGANIKLAVSKVNGIVLLPGEVFSFNQAVGPRSEAGGYKTANTYLAGKIVPGTGGGICQVSSTLYNSVLLSDLEVVERRHHTFTVGYVPYGRDATVSYNEVDFKFKNTTSWPLKIEAWVTSNNRLYFTLKGTNESPGKKIEISPKITRTIDFKIKYIDDPTLPEGVTKVKQAGKKGYDVETYKIVRVDGKVVGQTKLATNKYKPLDEEVLRGTKKVAAAGKPAPAPSQTPVPTAPAGVDDADNPPAPQ